MIWELIIIPRSTQGGASRLSITYDDGERVGLKLYCVYCGGVFLQLHSCCCTRMVIPQLKSYPTIISAA